MVDGENVMVEVPETFFVIDLNIHDLYSGDEGFPPKDEPLYWYLIGPFDTEEAASDWGNRNLQYFGVTSLPVTDPRDYDNEEG